MKAWHRPLVALGLLAPACSPGQPQPVHRATTGATSPLHPLEPADESIQPEPATTTTTEPPAPVTTVTVSKLPPDTRGATSTTVRPRPLPTTTLPENDAAALTDAERYATQPGYGPWSIPTYVVMCESGGSWTAENASGAAGPYQLMPEHFGGQSALNQSREAQHAKAAYLWNGGVNTRSGLGPQNWKACL